MGRLAWSRRIFTSFSNYWEREVERGREDGVMNWRREKNQKVCDFVLFTFCFCLKFMKCLRTVRNSVRWSIDRDDAGKGRNKSLHVKRGTSSHPPSLHPLSSLAPCAACTRGQGSQQRGESDKIYHTLLEGQTFLINHLFHLKKRKGRTWYL